MSSSNITLPEYAVPQIEALPWPGVPSWENVTTGSTVGVEPSSHTQPLIRDLSLENSIWSLRLDHFSEFHLNGTDFTGSSFFTNSTLFLEGTTLSLNPEMPWSPIPNLGKLLLFLNPLTLTSRVAEFWLMDQKWLHFL